MKPVSLRKAKKLLRSGIARYYRRRKKLPESMRDDLRELDQAIKAKDRQRADNAVQKLAPLFHRSRPVYIIEVIFGIVVAIVIATVVRQMWFEPMEIPSGSMRPTFQELDKLVVSKDTFGLNIPMMPKQFLFFPDNIERTGVFIFTSEDMPVHDQDTIYFFLFPGKKRLIKRMMGKPGDTLYFYGGQLYGIDKDGNELTVYRKAPWMEGLDYVPFMTFMGQPTPTRDSLTIKQFNQPIAKLRVLPTGKTKGELLAKSDLSDLWGMGNYAMVRLVTRSQLTSPPNERAPLYLELHHSPTIKNIEIGPGLQPRLQLQTSVIPLQQEQIDRLSQNLYTSRFIVENGYGYLHKDQRKKVRFPGVPDGRYQFQDGILYSVQWGGILKKLPSDHALYDSDHLQNLFNLGVSMNTLFTPKNAFNTPFPFRYAYYRNGDLYVMGHPFLSKDDPLLQDLTFQDAGPPTRETILRDGLTIPQGHYLALGDNHANSGDSRVFGFVPAENIRGTPSFIFWPPGSRFGPPAQKPYPWITIPRVIIWIVAILITAATFWWRHERKRRVLGHHPK